MARKLRIEYPGACYHVINRGNYRRAVFGQDGAKKSFRETLWETCERCGWRVHAYVIMSNHFHLALETPEPNLSVGMQWLQGTWANRFNRYRKENGHPFQGRFKAIVVEPGKALAEVVDYIHLNPVRAKLVSASQIGKYRWSSLADYLGKDRPKALYPEEFLGETGGLKDTRWGWRKYVQYLEWKSEEDASRQKARAGQLSRGWCIGTKEFRRELLDDLKKKSVRIDTNALLGIPAEEWREQKQEEWEALLEKLARAFRISLNKLPEKKLADEKQKLAAAMKQISTANNIWLAEHLRMGRAATVSQGVRRFRLADGQKQRDYRRVLSRFTT